MAPAIISIIFFFTTFMVIGTIYLRNRHRERLAMIQYGRHDLPKIEGRKNSPLKFGLLLFSIGAGLLIGGFFDAIFDVEPQGSFACIFIFSGLSLLYYHHTTADDKISQSTTSYKRNSFVAEEEEDDILI